jgi:hypothetical protein
LRSRTWRWDGRVKESVFGKGDEEEKIRVREGW